MTEDNRKHILIVDDNKDLRKLYELLDTISDIHITVYDDGLKALEWLSTTAESVNAVLIDLAMYPMDGISFAEQITTMEQVAPARKLKKAFFTAQNIDGVITRAMDELQINKIFKKPCEPFELLAEVKQWLAE